MKNDETLHKWVNGRLSEAEEAEFKQRPEYRELEELYRLTDNLQAPEVNTKGMLQNILSKEKAAPTSGRRVVMNSWLRFAAAAVFILGIAWFLIPRNDQVHFQTGVTEVSQLNLPDGSLATLQPGTSIDFKKDDWEGNSERSLQLNGEAFFEVKKGKRFTVNTPNGMVQVLGTSFNVRARGNRLEVKCKTGKVAVLDTNANQVAVLTPNQAAILKDGVLSEEKKLDERDWQSDLVSLEDTELEEILKEIEWRFGVRFFPGDINLKQISTAKFSPKDLSLALAASFNPLNIEYRVEGKDIYLKKIEEDE